MKYFLKFLHRSAKGLSGYSLDGGRRREKVCPACILETVRCRKLIFGRDIGWGCRCATSWCDLDLTFDLALVTLSLQNPVRAISQKP